MKRLMFTKKLPEIAHSEVYLTIFYISKEKLGGSALQNMPETNLQTWVC